MSNESEREEAIQALREVAMKKAAPYRKKLEKKAIRKVQKGLGVSKENMAKAMALAEIARSGKLKGKARLGKNWQLEGEIDVKNPAIKARATYEW